MIFTGAMAGLATLFHIAMFALQHGANRRVGAEVMAAQAGLRGGKNTGRDGQECEHQE